MTAERARRNMVAMNLRLTRSRCVPAAAPLLLLLAAALLAGCGGGAKNSSPSGTTTTPPTSTKAAGPVLETCTSTAKSVPTMLPGWKVTFYSARLSKTTSPDVSEANHVRTFSYKAIKALTSANDLYIRIEKADQSFLTGFGTAVESCDANNKITQYYSVRNRTGVEGKNVLASTFYFHGGNYLHGAGTYRVDAYVKTLDGKWHLVDRLSGLKITP